MNEGKTDKYTFSEKDILEILGAFESEIEERLQKEKKELEKVKYYEKFRMQDIDFKNIFITTEKDEKGNITQHVYAGNSSNKILSIDSEGKVTIDNPELEEFLGEVDLKKVIEENEKEQGNLKGISEKATPEDTKKMLDEASKNKEQGSEGDEQESDEQDGDEQEIKKNQEIEKDLQEQGEDLRITKSRQIKDNKVAERNPEVFENNEENRIAYSDKLNSFVMISKVDGKYKLNEAVSPAKTTWKTIISIDADGKNVERKVPNALMKMPNDAKKEIAVVIGQYGEIDIETVDVMPCQERIARSVRTQGEGSEKEESLEISNQFKSEGKEYGHDIAHQVENIEKAQKESGQEVDFEITPEDYIPNSDPEITWGDLMEATGESLPKLIERYNKEITNKDPNEAISTIEEDYGNVMHQHKR